MNGPTPASTNCNNVILCGVVCISHPLIPSEQKDDNIVLDYGEILAYLVPAICGRWTPVFGHVCLSFPVVFVHNSSCTEAKLQLKLR